METSPYRLKSALLEQLASELIVVCSKLDWREDRPLFKQFDRRSMTQYNMKSVINYNNKSTFLDKIYEVREALKQGLYNCALAMALTLPDICGKVEYPDKSSGYSKERYTNWFKKYAEPMFTSDTVVVPDSAVTQHTILTEKECYALRCAVLHAGNYKLNPALADLKKIKIHVYKGSLDIKEYYIRMDEYVSWDCTELCGKLCSAAEKYYEGIPDKTRFDIDEVVIETW